MILPFSWAFQQDFDPKHASKLVAAENINIFKRPVQSPDRNPIGILCDILILNRMTNRERVNGGKKKLFHAAKVFCRKTLAILLPP